MRACVQRLSQRRQNTDEDPFLKCDWDKFPDFVPFDTYLYPAVVLSALLVTYAETALMTTQFSACAHIQAGAVAVEVGNASQVMSEVHSFFVDALEAFYSAAPHYRALEATNGEVVLEDSLDSLHEPPQPLTVRAELEHNDSHDIPDISVAKESVLNFSLLARMMGADSEGLRAVAAAASKVLKTNYEITVSNKTGDIVYMPESYLKRPHSRASAMGEGSSKPSTGVGRGRTFNEKFVYRATAHDHSTIVSELLPLVENFGRDDVTAWIQWAMALSGGMSMAMLRFV